MTDQPKTFDLAEGERLLAASQETRKAAANRRRGERVDKLLQAAHIQAHDAWVEWRDENGEALVVALREAQQQAKYYRGLDRKSVSQVTALRAELARVEQRLAEYQIGPISHPISGDEAHYYQKLVLERGKTLRLEAELARVEAEQEHLLDGTVSNADYEMAEARIVELEGSLREAAEHMEELEGAWQRGVLHESDGKGGTRSNRNVAAARRAQKALEEAEHEPAE